jgi:hypothetical protein
VRSRKTQDFTTEDTEEDKKDRKNRVGKFSRLITGGSVTSWLACGRRSTQGKLMREKRRAEGIAGLWSCVAAPLGSALVEIAARI